MNQLLNEAIRIYLNRRGTKEQDLTESLDRLRAYRERDPGYHAALDAIADAESSLKDPLEGTLVTTPKRTHDRSSITSAEAAPTRTHEPLRV